MFIDINCTVIDRPINVHERFQRTRVAFAAILSLPLEALEQCWVRMGNTEVDGAPLLIPT